MVSAFTLKVPQRTVFGPGKFTELIDILSAVGSKPLFVFGSDSFLASTHYELLLQLLTDSKINLKKVHIHQEPSPDNINSLVKKFTLGEIDCVAGIGGGSVLDAAKALSAMLVERSNVFDFLEGVGHRVPSGRKLPFVAIPTTSGTGSEATANAVLSRVSNSGFKKSLRHDNFIPNCALIDPELTLSCPSSVTTSCGMDCFTQLVEGFLSTKSSQVTDLLALDGIRAIKRSLKMAVMMPENLPARTDLSYAAYLSGIVLANAGLGAVHGFASVVGGYCDIPHGVICSSLMAPANDYTLRKLRKGADSDQVSLKKYSELGKIFSSEESKSDSWYQDHFIAHLYKLSDELGIPALSSFGLVDSMVNTIASQTGDKFNPIALSKEERKAILLNDFS